MARSRPAGRVPRGRGQLELEVMGVLASAARPMTAADVQQELGDLAYTTVMTTLGRLYQKGALDRQQVGRAYEYRLLGGQQSARSNMAAHQMLKVLDDEADRRGVLTRFVAELSEDDEQLLASLLEQSAPTAPRRHRGRRST